MNQVLLFISFIILASSTELKPKFCINCKYHISNKNIFLSNNNNYDKCSYFTYSTSIKEDENFLVTGKKKELKNDYYYCSTARKFDTLCGPNGKHFKKKEE